MSEFKGTPGKWCVGMDGEILYDAGFIVMGTDLVQGNESDRELIAAAPELLEVLQETVEALKRAWNTGTLPHDIILEDLAHRQIKVIAKALGQ